jgi:sorbitol-specific phosphotransferase system component IIBC
VIVGVMWGGHLLKKNRKSQDAMSQSTAAVTALRKDIRTLTDRVDELFTGMPSENIQTVNIDGSAYPLFEGVTEKDYEAAVHYHNLLLTARRIAEKRRERDAQRANTSGDKQGRDDGRKDNETPRDDAQESHGVPRLHGHGGNS